ncbi:Uncharacterised protein [Mycobacteroides abscessus subsp. abscessus]|nr:Uncharacterised protein [Mycobacteroides abscessus subsp. abscessus]
MVDSRRLEMHVVLAERPVILIRHGWPLTAVVVCRRQCLAHPAVADLKKAEKCCELLRILVERSKPAVLPHRDEHQHLLGHVGHPAHRALCRRDLGEQSTDRSRNRKIEFGHDPHRRPLVNRQIADFLGEFRNHLHGSRTGPDHRCALTREIVVVVPARGVDDMSGE